MVEQVFTVCWQVGYDMQVFCPHEVGLPPELHVGYRPVSLHVLVQVIIDELQVMKREHVL